MRLLNKTTIVSLLLVIATIGACGDGPRSISGGDDDKRDPIDVALASSAADQRRNGVQRLSDSRNGGTDWAIEIYDTMARADVDSMVRCSALTALEKHDKAAALALIADLFGKQTIVTANAANNTTVRPPTPILRRSAARLLLRAAQAGAINDDTKLATAACTQLANEQDHQTRVVLLDALAYIPQRAVLTALIDALRVDDFAERRAAEGALVRLTGHTHAYDADAWQSWLATTNDPFAQAGNTPAGWNGETASNGKWWNVFN